MANENEAEDLDLGDEKSGKGKLIIIIAAVAVLLIGGGVAAYFLLFSGEEAPETAEQTNEESTESPAGPAQYLPLDPAFVVTLQGKPSLLQVGISVRFSGDEMAEFIQHNDPMIRHNLLNLLSVVDAQALKERTAKESLQQRLLDELNRILKELSAPGQVDALYFTSFVMQ